MLSKVAHFFYKNARSPAISELHKIAHIEYPNWIEIGLEWSEKSVCSNEKKKRLFGMGLMLYLTSDMTGEKRNSGSLEYKMKVRK